MNESDNNNSTSSDRKRKRLPVFSIILVSCYLVVAVLFFAYGIGAGPGRVPAAVPTESPPENTPTPVETFAPEPEPDVVAAILMPPPVQVKGIWVNVWFAGHEPGFYWDDYIDLIESTELNAIVIDVKEDNGHITFPTDNEAISRQRRGRGDLVPDMEELVTDLNDRGIYTIARVVCFKDLLYSSRNVQHALQDGNGNLWRDRSGNGWMNPFMRENWEYIVEICREAARLGFKEIQLDYVRFSLEGRLGDINEGTSEDEQTRYETIAEFVAFIREEMAVLGVRTSADIFGITAMSDRDAGIIGQNVQLLIPNLDAISPMIYPSHFANASGGAVGNGVGQVINDILFEAPDTEPYEVIYHSLQHFRRQLDRFAQENQGVEMAIIRPYLQDFTAAYLEDGFWIPYGAEEVRAQIQAVYDAGFEEWILWSHRGVYSEDAFRNP